MNRGPNEFFDGRIADWLEADPDTAPDQTLDVVLAAVPSIRQRQRGLALAGWRPNEMTGSLKFAIGVTAALVVAAGGLYLLAPRNAPGVGGSPAASPSPSADPSGSPAASAPAITEWQTVTSEWFGYSVDIPADWGESAPTNVLPPDYFPGDPTQYANRWDAPQTHSPSIVIAVRDPEPDESVTDWLTGTQAVFAADCYGTPSVEVIVDGEQATRSSGVCLTVNATVLVQWIHGGKAYTIMSSGAIGDEANLDAIVDRVVSSFRFRD